MKGRENEGARKYKQNFKEREKSRSEKKEPEKFMSTGA
jgi:hypothetical protein